MAKIQYLVMDVDGTLTDGRIYISPSGEVMKAFNIKDGYGIHDLLIPSGIIPVVITGRESEIVSIRCKELGIVEVYQAAYDKLQKLRGIISDFGAVAYIGDDLNDYASMIEIKKRGGIIGCPSDSAEKIKSICNYICKNKGGEGAVREYIEWLLL